MIAYYSYFVSDHYITAILNNDYSGLEEHEIIDIDNFLEECKILGIGHFNANFERDNFRICEICGLYSNCQELEYIVMDKMD